MNQYEILQERAECQLRPIERWPRTMTAERRDSQFRAEWQDSFSVLGYELDRLDAKDRVIQIAIRSNMWRQDGLPRNDVKGHDHPGVILCFTTKHSSVTMPCDTYREWKDNIRALALSLEALRAVDRYGVTKTGEQYRGWTAIEPPKPNGFKSADDAAKFITKAAGIDPQKWSLVLTEPGLSSAYRHAAAKLHPDQGGDHEQFVRLQEAKRLLESGAK